MCNSLQMKLWLRLFQKHFNNQQNKLFGSAYSSLINFLQNVACKVSNKEKS